MSSTVPSTSAPGTQSTATIFEFGCLYTHDVQRKQKRWQDGNLRFHSFNKRIMVYDLAGNFIGDMHWRESEGVQDGDELRLDRGVLIQVGEARGQREQDLTDIIERRKSTQINSTNNAKILPPTHNNPRSENTNISQLKPKSLNEVLGTPRGTHGRALLPSQSPFQTRQKLQSLVGNPRPTKRQKPNIETHKMVARDVADDHASPGRQPVISGTAIVGPKSGGRASKEIIHISSDDEIPEQAVSTKNLPAAAPDAVGTVQKLATDRNTSREPFPRPPEHAGGQRHGGRLISTKTKRSKLICLPKPPDNDLGTRKINFGEPSVATNGGVETSRRRGMIGGTTLRGASETRNLLDTSVMQISPSTTAVVTHLPTQEPVRLRNKENLKSYSASPIEPPASTVRTNPLRNQYELNGQSVRPKGVHANPILPHKAAPDANSGVATATEALLLPNEDSGPWSREAFDLFGWTKGSAKGVYQG